jgi:hypothetical protein
MTPQAVQYALNDLNPHAVFFDNMDSALVATGRRGAADPVAVYSQKLIFEQLYCDGLTESEAADYFFDKIVGLCVGPNTPVVLQDMDIIEE